MHKKICNILTSQNIKRTTVVSYDALAQTIINAMLPAGFLRRSYDSHGVKTPCRPKYVSPRVDNVKYSGRDGCSVLRMEVRVGFQKLQPRVMQEKFPDERL